MSQSYQASRSIPLAAIFLLIAVAAVLAGLAGQARVLSLAEAIPAVLRGAIVGLILGWIVGMYHFRRVRGSLIGLGTGSLVGALCGPIMAIAETKSTEQITFALAGSIALILLSVGSRLVNDRDPIRRKSWD